mmetsp:Transcript_29712/g.25006  ORF Transcript_29712/g.25006 Transcript_29712/m.25006 type:complete len:80 (+) Transcript_29712:65-304(+)
MINNTQLQAKLQDLFNMFDQVNSGYLDQNELLEFMELIGFMGINLDLLISAAGFDETKISFEDLSVFFGLGSEKDSENM